MQQKAKVGRQAQNQDPQFNVGNVKYDNDYGGLLNDYNKND